MITNDLTNTGRSIMNGKPVLHRQASTVLTVKNKAFQEKGLCDGLTLNLGDACALSCTYCYVGSAMHKLNHELIGNASHHLQTDLDHSNVVIRRENVLEVLHAQLFTKRGKMRKPIPRDKRVVYTSTLVDAAANSELLRETAAACNLLFEHTNLDVRILSKNPLLKRIVELVPEKYHQRLILGFSTGTLDDGIAKTIEKSTGLVSKRIEALHWLQDNGFRTFGMICPSLPQDDYASFSREICAAIRPDRCEHVWAEVINVRGDSFVKTLAALSTAGFTREAERLSSVCGPKSTARWEDYARQTFEAHKANIPADKLRFLQYVKKKTAGWWNDQIPHGAVVLGAAANP